MEKYLNTQPLNSLEMSYSHCIKSVVVVMVKDVTEIFAVVVSIGGDTGAARDSSASPAASQEAFVKNYDCEISIPNLQPVFPGPTPHPALQLKSTCYILSSCGPLQCCKCSCSC